MDILQLILSFKIELCIIACLFSGLVALKKQGEVHPNAPAINNFAVFIAAAVLCPIFWLIVCFNKVFKIGFYNYGRK